jgi:hypothetical protein
LAISYYSNQNAAPNSTFKIQQQKELTMKKSEETISNQNKIKSNFTMQHSKYYRDRIISSKRYARLLISVA